MTEAEWLTATNPHHLLWHWGKDGPKSRRVLLLGVACCRLFADFLVAPQTQAALDGLEDLADLTDLTDQKKLRRSVERQAVRGCHWADRVAEKYRIPAMAVSMLASLDHLNLFDNVVYYLRQVAEREGDLTSADRRLVGLIRDIFGNPFRPVVFDPGCRTSTVLGLARPMYESRDFAPMPILADALQDAGCDNAGVLAHCRDPQGTHVRGCWVVDLLLGKS